MKHLLTTLMLMILVSSACLLAQMTTPRVLVIRILDQDGSSLPDIKEEMKLQAILNGAERTENDVDFGYAYGLGDLYAKIQLGNFGLEWAPGDTVNVVISRIGSHFSQARMKFIIPDGSYPVFWGRIDTPERDFPGEPVRLYPFILNVEAQDPGIPVLINGKATALVTGTPVTAKTKDDITGIFSLAPPPSGWRWEPSKYVLTPRDFEFSESAYTDAEGVSRPGWARTLEFRLVPSDPEG
ncbi:MAG TPA: hypothetical protein PLQ80_09790 [Candidatus Syntrophosphaera sp.]|nr:hypothetical protein [Candidatus Syntrophosphaera sp.]